MGRALSRTALGLVFSLALLLRADKRHSYKTQKRKWIDKEEVCIIVKHRWGLGRHGFGDLLGKAATGGGL